MKIRILSFVMLFFLFAIFLYIGPSYTGYATYSSVQPGIHLNLTKTTYNSNEDLSGIIYLIFKGPISADSELSVSLGEAQDTKTIEEILFELYKTPSVEYGGLSVSNDETSKTLEFTSAGEKTLATQISAPLSELSFNMEGIALENSYPNSLMIDILEDEIPDYFYLGTFSNYSSEKIKAPSLDSTTKAYFLANSSNYYCELISLPYSKDFKINVESSGTGTIKAVLFPVTRDGEDVVAHYRTEACTPSSGSCALSLSEPIQKDALVCVLASSGVKLAKEEANLQNSQGYKCDVKYLSKEGDYDLCTPLNLPESEARLGDFFITVQAPIYSREFKTKELFEAPLDIINEYFSSCQESPCTIPILINSSSKGKLKITDINIQYGSTIKDYLSDLITTPDIIYQIDGKNLTNITIPLSLFNITIPAVTKDKKFDVTVSVGSSSDEDEIVVKKLEIANLTDYASDLKDKFSSFTDSQKEIYTFLNYNIANSLYQIGNYQTQISSIIKSNLSESEKTSKLNPIEQALKKIDTLPVIKIKSSLKEIPSIRPLEISDDYLPEEALAPNVKQQLMNLQANVKIKTDLIGFEFSLNNSKEEKTFIKKTITGTLNDFYVIEEIPKDVVSSSAQLIFGAEAHQILKSDPVVRWSADALPFSFSYIAPGTITSKYNKLITIILPKKISYEESKLYKNVRCGDGFCTSILEDRIICPEDCAKKINWWVVVILFFVLVLGIFYLNFYKGRLSYKQLTQKKPELFKTKADENNLRNYIKKALMHKVPIQKIKSILLHKGWTEQQIGYIFRTLR